MRKGSRREKKRTLHWFDKEMLKAEFRLPVFSFERFRRENEFIFVFNGKVNRLMLCWLYGDVVLRTCSSWVRGHFRSGEFWKSVWVSRSECLERTWLMDSERGWGLTGNPREGKAYGWSSSSMQANKKQVVFSERRWELKYLRCLKFGSFHAENKLWSSSRSVWVRTNSLS